MPGAPLTPSCGSQKCPIDKCPLGGANSPQLRTTGLKDLDQFSWFTGDSHLGCTVESIKNTNVHSPAQPGCIHLCGWAQGSTDRYFFRAHQVVLRRSQNLQALYWLCPHFFPGRRAQYYLSLIPHRVPQRSNERTFVKAPTPQSINNVKDRREKECAWKSFHGNEKLYTVLYYELGWFIFTVSYMHTTFTIWKRCGEFAVSLSSELIELFGSGWTENHIKSDQIARIVQIGKLSILLALKNSF